MGVPVEAALMTVLFRPPVNVGRRPSQLSAIQPSFRGRPRLRAGATGAAVGRRVPSVTNRLRVSTSRWRLSHRSHTVAGMGEPWTYRLPYSVISFNAVAI